MFTLSLSGLIQEDSGFSGSFYIIHFNKCMTNEWVRVGVPSPEWLRWKWINKKKWQGSRFLAMIWLVLKIEVLMAATADQRYLEAFDFEFCYKFPICLPFSGWLFPLQALAWTVWMVWLEQKKKSSTARARSTKMWWDHQPASSATHALLICCVHCANCWCQLSIT